MLLPQEIAEQLTPQECMDLEAIVAGAWGQAYGIVQVTRTHTRVVVEIELEDMTRHNIVLS